MESRTGARRLEAGGWRLDKSREEPRRSHPEQDGGRVRGRLCEAGDEEAGQERAPHHQPYPRLVLSPEPASVAAVGPRGVVMPHACARGGGLSQCREILLQRPDGPMAGRRWARDTRPQVSRAWEPGGVCCSARLVSRGAALAAPHVVDLLIDLSVVGRLAGLLAG